MARNDTKKFDYLRFSFDFINDKPLKDLMEFSGVRLPGNTVGRWRKGRHPHI